MKITKDFEGLKRLENGGYVLEGDLISEENIEVDLDDILVVRGSIISKKSIKAGEDIVAGLGIKAGCEIVAGCGIVSGMDIVAGRNIVAGLGIKAGWGIVAGEDIVAGLGIKAGWGIVAGEGIVAKTYIYSEKRIFAGIAPNRTDEDCEKTIKCAELRKGRVCFGDLDITSEGQE